MAALGLYILPTRRRQAKADLKTKMEALRARLADALTGQFERELGKSLQRVREAMAPYTRFVRSEREKLNEIESRLAETATNIAVLRGHVEDL